MTDILTWLRQLGLAHFEATFRDNEITAAALPELTEDDLRQLGLPLGPRKLILKSIAAMAGDASPPTSRTVARAPMPALHGEPERRQLTVMFVDLVGSTALSAQLDPEDMREVIGAYQSAVASEISRFEGHVAQFVGDGVLAYFGWPRAHEDEAERAVRAGLAVKQAISQLRLRQRLPAAKGLQARIGIATGLVVVGDLVGEAAVQEQAVVGDPPNLAARLQGAAKPGMVIVADATRRLLGDLFVLRDLGALTLKGIHEPVSAFAVRGERALETRFAAKQGKGVTPIVGRDQELGLLLEHWRKSQDGTGQVVLLTGEAGIGKSRITEALVDTIQGELHFLLRYQCSPFHTRSALYPAIQQIEIAAGFAEDDGDEPRLDKIEALVARSTDKVGAVAPLLATLLGLDAASRYGALTLTPQQRRSRTLAVLIDQLAGLAGRRPVLWVVEDAHWIDPTTLELIELALDRVRETRVLVVITARPTFVATFASHPVVTRLALNRLPLAATQAIVAHIATGKRLPEVLLDEIVAKTDGVPLFVEEMTKAVIESKVLAESAEAYHLDGPLSALAIPTTLHDSLMARLDRMHPMKEVAQTAAVIGRNFDHRTIAALVALPEHQLAEAMRRLVEADLIFSRGTPPDAMYLFKHALVRDAAYESLLKANRIVLHARLVEVLEQSGDAAPEVKAQHAEVAGLAERALGYWEQASVHAMARPAYREAIASLQNAIRLCRAVGDNPQGWRREYSLQLQLAQALTASLGYQAPETVRAFERGLELADKIGDVSLQVPAVFGKWSSIYVGGGLSAELTHRFAALVETQPTTGPRLVGLRLLALERFHVGRFKESLVLTGKALDAYNPATHRDLAYSFLHDPRTAAANYHGWNLWHLGFPDQAARMSDDNLGWTKKLDHANTTGVALCYGVTVLNIWLRRPDRVESAAREALKLAEENSMALWHAFAQIHLGWALSQQGKGLGLDEIEAGLRETYQLGVLRLEPLHLSLAADACARAGRHYDAGVHLAKAFSALEHGRDLALAADLYRKRGVLALRIDALNRDAAEIDLRKALEIARQQEAPSLQLRAAHNLAWVLAERGEQQHAADLLAPIYDWFTEGFAMPDLIEAKSLLDELI